MVDITTQDLCDSSLNHAQIIIWRAKVDGNFSITAGDSPAVHEISVSALASVCFGKNKDLFTYQIITGEAE